MWIRVVSGTTPTTYLYRVEQIVRIVAPAGSLTQMAVTMTSTNTFSGVITADWNAGELLDENFALVGPNPIQV